MPLNMTMVAPVRPLPTILTVAPISPEMGSVFTNGPRPADRLNTMPQPYSQAVLFPPKAVVP